MPVDRYNLSRNSWVCPKAASHKDMSETPLLEGVKKASWPEAWTTSNVHFLCRGSVTLPKKIWAPHLIPEGEPSHSWLSATRICDVILLVISHRTIFEGCNIDWPVNRQLLLLAQFSLNQNRFNVHIADWQRRMMVYYMYIYISIYIEIYMLSVNLYNMACLSTAFFPSPGHHLWGNPSGEPHQKLSRSSHTRYHSALMDLTNT